MANARRNMMKPNDSLLFAVCRVKLNKATNGKAGFTPFLLNYVNINEHSSLLFPYPSFSIREQHIR